MTDDLVLVLSNRGVALRYLGRVDEALDAYEHAAALLPRAGYLYALMQNNIGDAHLLLGDYQASLAALAEARQAFADQDAELRSADLHQPHGRRLPCPKPIPGSACPLSSSGRKSGNNRLSLLPRQGALGHRCSPYCPV